MSFRHFPYRPYWIKVSRIEWPDYPIYSPLLKLVSRTLSWIGLSFCIKVREALSSFSCAAISIKGTILCQWLFAREVPQALFQNRNGSFPFPPKSSRTSAKAFSDYASMKICISRLLESYWRSYIWMMKEFTVFVTHTLVSVTRDPCLIYAENLWSFFWIPRDVLFSPLQTLPLMLRRQKYLRSTDTAWNHLLLNGFFYRCKTFISVCKVHGELKVENMTSFSWRPDIIFKISFLLISQKMGPTSSLIRCEAFSWKDKLDLSFGPIYLFGNSMMT